MNNYPRQLHGGKTPAMIYKKILQFLTEKWEINLYKLPKNMETKMALVSIIMPCHNGARYLNESVSSVLSQTYTDWELLIIDDNSTDDSVSIIKEFCLKDSRIKFFQTEKSTGKPATPRNVGINEAKGRYIAFLDCDDVWLANKLNNQIPLFFDENCAVVFSYYKKMNENRDVISEDIVSPEFVTYKKLLNGDCIGNLTGVYDTQKVGKVFQHEIHAEDYLMWLEVLKKGFIAKNTNTVEGLYRITSSSISANKFKSALWNWNIYKNELKLPFIKAAYHFTIYCIKGLLKFLK